MPPILPQDFKHHVVVVLYNGHGSPNGNLARHCRADGAVLVDSPHVRDRHPASQGAGCGERFRLHAGQPRRGAARSGARGAAPRSAGGPPAQPRVHAECRVPRSAGAPRGGPRGAYGHPVPRRRPDHDQRGGGGDQHRAQGGARSGRRSHRSESLFPGVPLLHREPRRARRDGGNRRPLPARYRSHRRRHHAAHQGPAAEFAE